MGALIYKQTWPPNREGVAGTPLRASEFAIIDQYFRRPASAASGVVLGIGDDAALVRVPLGYELAITTDTLASEIHFRASDPPEDIGYKSLAASLSDLAAMGAAPAWASLALTLPAPDEPWIAAFAQGFFELASSFGVSLIGGDLTRGPLSVTVTLHGLVPVGQALRRSGAAAGDAVYVSGTLGDAGLALRKKLATVVDAAEDYLLARLRRPSPRVALGQTLRGLASAAIDISDGLSGDLGHILASSGVGAVVEVDRLPLSPALRQSIGQHQAWELAVHAGDDYELCFTVPEARESELGKRMAALAGETVTRIGTLTAEPGLRFIRADGSEWSAPGESFRHF